MTADVLAHVSGLLSLIYDAALEPAQWPDALAAIKAAVGAEVSALLRWDNRTIPIVASVAAVSGYSESAVKAYEAYFSARDVRRPAFAALPPGAVYVDDRHLPFAEVARSEIFHDFYRPLGVGHCMAAKLFDDAARTGLLSVHRPLSHGAFHTRDIALMEDLAPHLVRALQLQRQIANARHVARGAAVGLDHFHIAVFVVNADAMIVEQNAAATALLREAACPLRREDRRLHATMPQTTRRLHEAIRAAADALTDHPAPPRANLRLPRTDGGGVLGVMIAPVRRDRLPDGDALARMAEPLALVFAADPAAPVALAAAELRRHFGLSAAEANVAIQLAGGASIETIAARRSVSRETVRAQIKRVLAKTETHSQAQFIATIARSVATLRRQHDA